MRVKIIGGGSAGMHHAHAARQLGWDVDIYDNDEAALKRLPESYAQRYGAWDDAIQDCICAGRSYDLAIIATPPEFHVNLALKESGRVLIEKPLCTVGQIEGAKLLRGKPVFVGYGHVLKADIPKKPVKLKVNWCEHWSHILKAHPWLAGPHDSYLGYWHRGGGALSEHSHGLNLWQHIARSCGKGEVAKVKSDIKYENGYDASVFMTLKTDKGFIGHVKQDVTSDLTVKWASTGQEFGKHDFRAVLEHVSTADPLTSPLSLENGLSTAMVISAAHKSAREGRSVDLSDLHS